MKKNTNILNAKPIKAWEFREYKKGSLLENGIALNGTATLIYKLCDGNKTVDEIIRIILKNYRVSRKRAQNDVINCIKELLNSDSIKLK